MILNIETSEKACSVALCSQGDIMYQLSETEPMRHSEKLAPFVDSILKEMRKRDAKLEAVAVSAGPGSYTGLRIGLSTAKGVSFALNTPLILVPALKIWAVKAMFSSCIWEGDEIIIPMMDARRMEVYTAGYDFRLQEVMKPQALILDEESLDGFMPDKKIIIVGSGAEKVKKAYEKNEILHGLKGRVIFPEIGNNLFASDMTALSEKMFNEQDFSDVAYCEPIYIKEFQATKPKNRVLQGESNEKK